MGWMKVAISIFLKCRFGSFFVRMLNFIRIFRDADKMICN